MSFLEPESLLHEKSKLRLADKVTLTLINKKFCKNCLVLAACSTGCPPIFNIHSKMVSWLISRDLEQWVGAERKFNELMGEGNGS